MTPRATPLAPEDRRTAILDGAVPLLVEKGGDVTTKEIAQAAGIAEGTIFRVFPDKATLLFAAAEEAINPAGGQEAFDAAMAGAADLREAIVIAATRVLDRMRLTMAVMGAVRPYLAAMYHEASSKRRSRSRSARPSSCSRPSATCTTGSPGCSRRTPTSSPSTPRRPRSRCAA